MKILVTGATGFVGGAFIEHMGSEGRVSLRAALRKDTQVRFSGIETIGVEGLTATANWNEAVKGCDAVVHAAARVHIMQDISADPLSEFRHVNVQGTLNLARQAAHAGVKRFIFISSVKVNGEETALNRPFTSDTPLLPVDPYGISKYEAESGLLQIMRETGMEVVIMRLPLVYGPGVKANFLRLLKLIHKGFPLPLGSIHNSRSMIYIGNLVSAITFCLENSKAAGETFLVSDNEDISTVELVRKIASAMGQPAILFPLPLAILRLLFVLTGKRGEIDRLTGSLCVDSSKIQNLLNYRPPYTLDQGIRKTVDWYLAHV